MSIHLSSPKACRKSKRLHQVYFEMIFFRRRKVLPTGTSKERLRLSRHMPSSGCTYEAPAARQGQTKTHRAGFLRSTKENRLKAQSILLRILKKPPPVKKLNIRFAKAGNAAIKISLNIDPL